MCSKISNKRSSSEYFVKKEKFDCVFRVNRFRPHDLDKNVRHISWFQDFDLINNYDFVTPLDDDIIYSTTSLTRLGLKNDVTKIKNRILPLAISNDYVNSD